MKNMLLNELFEFFSIFRVKKIESCGIPIYYNDAFKSVFLDIISRDRFGSNIKDEIEIMLNSGQLNVGFTTSNIFVDLYNEFKKRVISKFITIDQKYRILGLFCPIDGKVSIILDENTTFFKSAKEDRVLNVLFHELCHYFLFLYPIHFINYTKDVIQKFYKNLLEAIKPIPLENMNKAEKVLRDISIKLMLRERLVEHNIEIIIEESSRLWLNAVDDIYNDDNSKAKVLNFIAKVINAIVDASNLNITDLVNNVFSIFHFAYEKTFNITNKERLYEIFFGQELMFPSEIIAVAHNIGDKKLSEKIIKELI